MAPGLFVFTALIDRVQRHVVEMWEQWLTLPAGSVAKTVTCQTLALYHHLDSHVFCIYLQHYLPHYH